MLSLFAPTLIRLLLDALKLQLQSPDPILSFCKRLQRFVERLLSLHSLGVCSLSLVLGLRCHLLGVMVLGGQDVSMGKMVLVGPKSALQFQRSLDSLQHGRVKKD